MNEYGAGLPNDMAMVIDERGNLSRGVEREVLGCAGRREVDRDDVESEIELSREDPDLSAVRRTAHVEELHRVWR
jgi:hypothetical protein